MLVFQVTVTLRRFSMQSFLNQTRWYCMTTQFVITSIILLKYSFYLSFKGNTCFVNMLHFIVFDLQIEQLCYGKQRTKSSIKSLLSS